MSFQNKALKPFFVLSAILFGCVPMHVTEQANTCHRSGPLAFQESKAILIFPQKQDLLRISQTPLPDQQTAPNFQVVEVSDWKLTPPFPENIGTEPYQDKSPLGKAISKFVTSSGGKIGFSRAHKCTARQLGLFYLRHGAAPGNSGESFMASRCGTPSLRFVSSVFVKGIKSSVSNAEAFAKFSKSVKVNLETYRSKKTSHIGAWFGRLKNRAVVVILPGSERVRIEPIPELSPDADSVVIRGRLNFTAVAIKGLINQGSIGVASCEPAANLLLPDLMLRCPIRHGDQSALIQLDAVEPERDLATNFAHILVRRSGAKLLAHSGPSFGPERPVSDEREFAIQALKGINQIRKNACLSPMTLSEAQSKMATSLAPQFFSEGFIEKSPDVADKIAKGLAAGWDVPGIVRDGTFLAEKVGNTNNVNRWLASAFSQPAVRKTLLAPSAKTFALGGLVLPDNGGLAALFSTFSFYTDADVARELRVVRQRISEARLSRGLKVSFVGFSGFSQEIRRVRSKNVLPQQVLDELLCRASASWQRPAGGGVMEFLTASQFVVPQELLNPAYQNIALGLTYHRAPRGAWGQYVLFIVVQQ